MGGRRYWGLALLGSTPEIFSSEHKPLPSHFPLEVSVSSVLEVCPPTLPCRPWGVRDGTSQNISSRAASHDARQVLSKTVCSPV